MGTNFRQTATGGIEFIDDVSSKNLLKIEPKGTLYGDLATRATFFDDFLGKAILGTWDVQKGSDASTSHFAVSTAANGMVRGGTGANASADMAGNGVQLSAALNWYPNQGNLVFEAKVKAAAITNLALFVGFTDQLASLEMPFTLGASNALTSNATDGVGFLFDTAADADNWWAVGVANNTDATKQNLAVAPTAGTYETLRIELTTGGVATFFRNGAQIGSTMTGATTASVALTPVIAAFRRTNSSTTIDADYIFVQQDR